MKRLVFNSTPLIYLTRAGLSDVFEGLKAERLTVQSVKQEVVDEGKRRGVPDSIVLERLFASGVFRVVEPKDKVILSRLLKTRGLHVTDAEVLALAHECEGVAVVDDEVARKTAKVFRIGCVGSPFLLVRAIYEGLISKERAKQGVNDMVFAGWRCNVETYVRIMRVLDKVSV